MNADNEIGSEPNDTDIAEAAAEAIRTNIDISPNRVRADVQNGWIILTGEVDQEDQRRSAESSVDKLKGVKGVTNSITLKGRVEQEELGQRIEDAVRLGARLGTTSPPRKDRRGWSGARITALVSGCVLVFVSLGLLAGGSVAAWADNTQRDSTGYLTSRSHTFATPSYALTSRQIDLGRMAGPFAPSQILGTVRLRVTPIDAHSPLFAGVGPTSAVNGYLAGVSHEQLKNWAIGAGSHTALGGAPATAPGALTFWVAQSSGLGTQTLTWKPTHGSWTAVVMNSNSTPGVSLTAAVGATVPDLGWMAVGQLLAGAVLLIAGVALVLIPILRASR